jgi:predicted nucleic acid-binding protein
MTLFDTSVIIDARDTFSSQSPISLRERTRLACCFRRLAENVHPATLPDFSFQNFSFLFVDRLKAEGKTAKSKIPLSDFLIGAHAEADGMKLVTRDSARVSVYFPQVELIQP